MVNLLIHARIKAKGGVLWFEEGCNCTNDTFACIIHALDVVGG